MCTERVKSAALLALPFAAVLIGTSPAAAQWRAVQPQNQQAMRYAEMDSNGDGVITRSEWRGTRQAFNAADTNRDGVLSGTEVWEDRNDRAVGTSGSVRERREQFAELDINGDGIVNRNEWDGTRSQFNQFDLNGDGVITRREYVGFEAGQADNGVASQSTSGPVTVFVEPTNRWTDTGLYVNQGDIIMFNAQGSVQLSDNGNDIAAPAGSQNQRRAENAPIRDAFAGALIGRIGNSAPFGIGNQRQITAPASGLLFLGVNDDVLDDNRGGFRVRASVR